MSEPTLDVAGIFDRASAEYDHTGVAFFTPLGAALVERAAVRPGEAVLDLGCGRGACLFPAARATGPGGSVLGLDVAPGMVAATTADLAREGIGNAEVRVGDAMALDDLPSSAFDVALSGLVLFFVAEPPVAVASLHRLLRPGGRLAFSSFAGRDERWQPVSELLVAFGGAAAQPPGAAHFASDASVDDLLAGAGFVDVVQRGRRGRRGVPRRGGVGAVVALALPAGGLRDPSGGVPRRGAGRGPGPRRGPPRRRRPPRPALPGPVHHRPPPHLNREHPGAPGPDAP